MKKTNKSDKVVIEIIVVALIIIFAFIVRAKGYQNGKRFSFDEGLYVQMAMQMAYDINQYNAINYCLQYPEQRQATMPDYLWNKLFKHPPMYCYLILMSYKIHQDFGDPMNDLKTQAVAVSKIMGIIGIIAVYLIGRAVFGSIVGIIAAFFMAIDPVHWICSQKVWMETTFTTFILLSGLFYIYSYRKKEGNILFFILTGLSIGCATLTKYPGAIALFAILAYTMLTRKKMLLSPKWFIIPLSVFFVLIHWIMWNFEVYGIEFIVPKSRGFEDILAGYGTLKTIALIFIPLIACLIGVYFILRKHKNVIHFDSLKKIKLPSFVFNKYLWLAVLSTGFILINYKDLIKVIPALSLYNEPVTGWRMGLFFGEPKYFYLKKLFEYFPGYLIGYIAPFFMKWDEREHKILPVLFAWMIFVFFAVWGNYQCRYILPAVPWFLLLSAYGMVFLYKKISLIQNKNLRVSLLVLFCVLIGLSIAKTIQVDLLLALTNKPCYF